MSKFKDEFDRRVGVHQERVEEVNKTLNELLAELQEDYNVTANSFGGYPARWSISFGDTYTAELTLPVVKQYRTEVISRNKYGEVDETREIPMRDALERWFLETFDFKDSM